MSLAADQAPSERVPAAEVAAVAAKQPSGLAAVPLDWSVSVSHRDSAPREWLSATDRSRFSGKAQPGEFYVFQVAVVSSATVDGALVKCDFLSCGRKRVPVRCLNAGGIGPDGMPFLKRLELRANKVQALWFGLDVPSDASGAYDGAIKILGPTEWARVDVDLTVGGPVLKDHGDGDPKRPARLRWLDSRIAQDDTVVKPYRPLRIAGNRIRTLGHEIAIQPNGLPEQIFSYYTPGLRLGRAAHPTLAGPMELKVVRNGHPISWKWEPLRWISRQASEAQWSVRGTSANLIVDVDASVGLDGYVKCGIALSGATGADLDDVRVETPYAKDASTYICGLGVEGRTRQEDVHWRWDVKKHQDVLWMGGVSAGAAMRFKGGNYKRPLVNIYYALGPLADPDSWDNEGLGGIDVVDRGDRTVVSAYSGACAVKRTDALWFRMEIVPTPVKPIDTDEHWATRYYHGDPTAALRDVQPGGYDTVNVHHASEINPFINYPYSAEAFPALVDYVARAHAEKLKVKIYYTTRELTQNLPELDALYSLNGEVVFPGPGAATRTLIHPDGPDPWLKGHFDGDYIPAWVARIGGKFKNRLDLAMITTPESRWNNFYLEGLDYLARKAGIDGVYIDDSALDRRSLLRARRILESRRPKPMIDLHSWNHFNEWAGYACNILLYVELLPYIDRLWFGEGFDYDRSPDYWLVEISGLPFGLMGEMLQGGGNPWRGMLYGMTNRLPWSGDPRPIWKAWDAFGMKGTEMLGYWDPSCPVRTGRSDVLATVYRKKGKALIAVASWAREALDVNLEIDWKALGLDPAAAVVTAPVIEGFQDARVFKPGEPIPVQPGKGWMLVVVAKPG